MLSSLLWKIMNSEETDFSVAVPASQKVLPRFYAFKWWTTLHCCTIILAATVGHLKVFAVLSRFLILSELFGKEAHVDNYYVKRAINLTLVISFHSKLREF